MRVQQLENACLIITALCRLFVARPYQVPILS